MKNLFTILLIVCAFIGYGQNNSIIINEFNDNRLIKRLDSMILVAKLDNYSGFDKSYIKRVLHGYDKIQLNSTIEPKTPTIDDGSGYIYTINLSGDTIGYQSPSGCRVQFMDIPISVPIIDLLLEYKQECFNDSVYVEYWKHNSPPSYTDPKTGITMSLAIYISPTLIKEWRHKNPSDFGDFLNWIEKRKNK